MYYILGKNENSEFVDGPMTRNDLQDRLDNSYYGKRVQILDRRPEGKEYGIFIIKAEIIIPKKVTVITRYEF